MSFLAGIQNHDSSYFKVTSPDLTMEVHEEDIISLTYNEKANQMSSGTLSFLDTNNYYSKILNVGIPLTIEFGYNKSDNPLEQLGIVAANPDELFGANARLNVKGIVQNPSGSADSNGKQIYNCNFYSGPGFGEKKRVTWIGLTKEALVLFLLVLIGVKIPLVNFEGMKDPLTLDNGWPQSSSDYYELVKMARQWRTIFCLSYNVAGILSAIFISPDKMKDTIVARTITQGIAGNSIYLDYNSEIGNVISYNWKNHAGDSGSGSNVHINYHTVPPTFIRYVTKGDTTLVYTLKPEVMEEEISKTKDIIAKLGKLRDWLAEKDFQKLVDKGYFVLTLETTSPEGLGYSMQVETFGKPLTTASISVVYSKKGFPKWFTPKSDLIKLSNFTVQGVTHKIDRDGYFMTLDIQDYFTSNGGKLL